MSRDSSQGGEHFSSAGMVQLQPCLLPGDVPRSLPSAGVWLQRSFAQAKLFPGQGQLQMLGTGKRNSVLLQLERSQGKNFPVVHPERTEEITERRNRKGLLSPKPPLGPPIPA